MIKVIKAIAVLLIFMLTGVEIKAQTDPQVVVDVSRSDTPNSY